MFKEISRQAVVKKIQEVKAMRLGKVGDIIINILKELLEE